MPSFIKIVQAVKKLNSISRERLNFRRRPILFTTLYRNIMQANNFGGTFHQLFLWIFSWNFHRRCLSTFSIPWCKKVGNDHKLKSRGSCLKVERSPPPWLLLFELCYLKHYGSVNFGGTVPANFSFEFFHEIFTEDVSLVFFYTMMQKSRKWPQTQIKGVLP